MILTAGFLSCIDLGQGKGDAGRPCPPKVPVPAGASAEVVVGEEVSRPRRYPEDE
jgi:hypothetical protein